MDGARGASGDASEPEDVSDGSGTDADGDGAGQSADHEREAASAAGEGGDAQRKKALKKMYKRRYQQKKSIKRKLKRFQQTTGDDACIVFVTRNSQRKFGCNVEFFNPGSASTAGGGHFLDAWFRQQRKTLDDWVQARYKPQHTTAAAPAANSTVALSAAPDSTAPQSLSHPPTPRRSSQQMLPVQPQQPRSTAAPVSFHPSHSLSQLHERHFLFSPPSVLYAHLSGAEPMDYLTRGSSSATLEPPAAPHETHSRTNTPNPSFLDGSAVGQMASARQHDSITRAAALHTDDNANGWTAAVSPFVARSRSTPTPGELGDGNTSPASASALPMRRAHLRPDHTD
jgi:hypothetical protein